MLSSTPLFFLWLFLLQYKYTHRPTYLSNFSACSYAKLINTTHCLRPHYMLNKMSINFFVIVVLAIFRRVF